MATESLSLTLQNAGLETAYRSLQLLQDRKRDFIIPAGSLSCVGGDLVAYDVSVTDPSTGLKNVCSIRLAINDVALEGLSQKLNIPINYLKTCRDKHPELFDQNVGGWLRWNANQGKGRSFYVRTYLDLSAESALEPIVTGVARGFLSDRYFTFDNFDLLQTVLRTVRASSEKHGLNIQVANCDLSDRRFYVRFTCPDVYAESEVALKNYRKPDGSKGGGTGISNGIVTGFVLSNSEVGAGSLRVSPRVTILACDNGMIWNEEGFKRMHLGGKMEEGEVVWSVATVEANAVLLQRQIEDVITRYLSPEFLAQRVADIEAMAAHQLEHPIECVRNVAKSLGLSEEAESDLLGYFANQGSAKTAFDVAQAVTFYAQHDARPDERFDLEMAAAEMLPLVKKSDYRKPTPAVSVRNN